MGQDRTAMNNNISTYEYEQAMRIFSLFDLKRIVVVVGRLNVVVGFLRLHVKRSNPNAEAKNK